MSEKKEWPSLEDFEEVRKKRERFRDIQARRNEAERRYADEQMALSQRQEWDQNKTQTAAEALVRGENPGQAEEERVKLGEIQEELQVLRLAEQMARNEVQRVEVEASQEICKQLRGEFEAAWKRFGEEIVGATEAATHLQELYDRLIQEDVTFTSGLPMALPLENWDARERGSRANRAVSEIEATWGLKIDRPTLEETERIREKLHLDRQARKVQEDKKEEKERRRRVKEGQKAHSKFLRGLGMPG